MFNLGAGEIIVILVLALVFLGPKQLPEMASKLGKVIRDIRKATSDIKNEITLDESFRKPFEDLRDAVTLHPDELRRREEIQRSVEEAKKRAAADIARLEAEAEAAATAAAAPTEAEATPPPEPTVSPPPVVSPVLPPVVPPVLPPVGTVASTIHGVPPAATAEENAPVPAPTGEESAPTPFARPRLPTPNAAILTSAVTPLGSAPRVTPPVSSLSGDRANTTQTLSEADLLASAPPPRRKSTPPPLPGLDRNPPPANRMGLPRVNPPVSSLSGDRANATQSLSESDLLPPGASKPPPLPGSKKA